MGSQGGLPWGSQGALWADWPWAMGRWALGHGPMGPLGRLALWTRAHGPGAHGPQGPAEFLKKIMWIFLINPILTYKPIKITKPLLMEPSFNPFMLTFASVTRCIRAFIVFYFVDRGVEIFLISNG